VNLLETEKQELENHFMALRNKHKDLLSLVSFLEEENKKLLQNTLSP